VPSEVKIKRFGDLSPPSEKNVSGNYKMDYMMETGKIFEALDLHSK
jgi:hypothetical protein